ncbi:hypothetical protein KC887_00600 [Candidatus Kaiserbacteria bacterium]|nr:hypothetical protein [Candidatus Kaiserbacteria bacterium]
MIKEFGNLINGQDYLVKDQRFKSEYVARFFNWKDVSSFMPGQETTDALVKGYFSPLHLGIESAQGIAHKFIQNRMPMIKVVWPYEVNSIYIIEHAPKKK